MANYLVLATPRSFAKNDDAPIRLLEENGCEVVRLPKDGGRSDRPAGGVPAPGGRGDRGPGAL